MGTIKDAIIDSAIKSGYEGEAPKTIAQAVDALAGVAGGGSGGAGGYTYSTTTTDLVHEQTINITEVTSGGVIQKYSPITVDTQACAGIVSGSGVSAKCMLDGTEYNVLARKYDSDGVITYDFAVYEGEYDPDSATGIYIFTPPQRDGYFLFVNGMDEIGSGSHVIRIYYEGVNVTFEQPFIDALKYALNN